VERAASRIKTHEMAIYLPSIRQLSCGCFMPLRGGIVPQQQSMAPSEKTALWRVGRTVKSATAGRRPWNPGNHEAWEKKSTEKRGGIHSEENNQHSGLLR